MQNSETRSIGNNLIFSFLITAIIGLVNNAYPILIGLIYGPEIMGLFSILFYWSMILSIPITKGIAPAITRFIASEDFLKSDEIEKIGEKTSTYYLFAASIIYTIIAITLIQFTLIDITLILILIITMSYHYLYRGRLQGEEKFGYLLKIEVISFCIFIPFLLVFSIFPAAFSWHGWLNNHYILFIPIIVYHLIFNLIIVFRRLKSFKIKEIFSLPSESKSILKYASIIGLGSIFGIGISQIQVIISENYLSNYEVGVLSFLSSINSTIILVSVTVGAILIPRIANLKKTKKKYEFEFTKMVNFSIILIIIPLIGILFILIGMYPSFVDVLTLNKYQMDTYWIILILLATQVICNLLATPTISFFASSEKYVKFNLIISVVYTFGVIISWISLVPKYGIYGFALGMALGGFLLNFTAQIILLIITKGKLGYNVFLFIGVYTILGVCILLILYSYALISIIIWSIISIPMLGFGLKLLIKLLRNKDFSKKYSNSSNGELVEEKEILNNISK